MYAELAPLMAPGISTQARTRVSVNASARVNDRVRIRVRVRFRFRGKGSVRVRARVGVGVKFQDRFNKLYWPRQPVSPARVYCGVEVIRSSRQLVTALVPKYPSPSIPLALVLLLRVTFRAKHPSTSTLTCPGGFNPQPKCPDPNHPEPCHGGSQGSDEAISQRLVGYIEVITTLGLGLWIGARG